MRISEFGLEDPKSEFRNPQSEIEFGPVLSVEVGSYRYDPLSELHHSKPVESGILLEVWLQAACGLRPYAL